MGKPSLVVGLVVVGLFASRGHAQRPGGRLREPSGLKTMTWKVGDVERKALVHEPDGGDSEAKRPLVIAFHGHGGRSAALARKLDFQTLWPEAVCVYPQGLPTPTPIDADGKLPGWQRSTGDQGDRDLAFFDAILNTMIAEHRADERRVYVVGHSNGGFFAYLLCAARGDKLAAVAPIAASINPRDARKQVPLPILHVAGESDKIVRFAMQELAIKRDRKVNGCEGEGKPSGKYCTEYASPKGTPVVAMIHPGGHPIPDEAAPRIVSFFKEHARAKPE